MAEPGDWAGRGSTAGITWRRDRGPGWDGGGPGPPAGGTLTARRSQVRPCTEQPEPSTRAGGSLTGVSTETEADVGVALLYHALT